MTEVLRGGEPDWAAAEAVAARHREQRLHPPVAVRRADRVLVPIGIVLWAAAVVLAVLGFGLPLIPGFVVTVIGFGAMLAYFVVALVWGSRTGRWLLRGSAFSIRSALPLTARPSVRRQLALREPVDPEHPAVTVELAHQNRALLAGQGAFLGFYVPFYLQMAHNGHDPVFGVVILAIATALLVVAAGFGVVAHRRFTRIIRTDDSD